MPSPARAPRRGPRRRRLLLLGGLVLGLVGAAEAVWVHPSELAREVEERAIPALAQRLGREVTAGRATASWLPLRVEVRGVRIAGGPGEPPLLTVEAVRLSPRLGVLLRSRGRRVELKSLELRRPALVVVRRPDGSSSLSDLARAAGPAPQPAGPEARQLSADRLSVVDGTVRLVDRSAPGREEDAPLLSQVRLVARGVVPGRPLKLLGKAALASAGPGLRVALSVDPLPAGVQALRAHPPRVKARFSVEGASLAPLRALLPAGALPLQGGAVSLRGEVSTGADGSYQGHGRVALAGAAFRGRPASAEADWTGALDATRPDAARVELQGLHLQAMGDALSGSAALSPPGVELALRGARVDLAPWLAVRSGRLAPGALTATDLALQATYRRGVLTLSRARAGLARGSLVADGSEVDLTQAEPRWTLRAVLDQLDLAQLTGGRSVEGTASGPVLLVGRGTRWSRSREGLTGHGELTLRRVRLTQLNLGRILLSPVTGALRAVGLKKQAEPGAAPGRGTALQDFTMQFEVGAGWLRLKRPVELVADFGRAELGGRIGLDERLDLAGSASLQPEVVSEEVGHPPGGPLHYPLTVTGTLHHPLIQARARPDQLLGDLLSAGGRATAAGRRAAHGLRKLSPLPRRKR